MPAPLHVAVDVSPLFDAKPTGIGVFTKRLLERLPAHDVEIHPYAVGLSNLAHLRRHRRASRSSRRPVRAPMANLVRGRHIQERWLNDRRPRIEDLASKDVQVVHGPNLSVPGSRTGVPRLVSVGDLFALRHPPYEGMFPNSVKLVQRAVASGAHVHVMSEAMRDDALELLDLEPERLHLIPLGAPAKAAEIVPLGQRERSILAVGNAEPRKNYVSLIQGFAQARAAGLDDAHLDIVAAGVDGPRGSDMRAEVARLGLDGAVKLHDFQADDEVQALMAKARLYLYPSLYEGFGLPILEAMAVGTPVITSGLGSTGEIGGDGVFLCGTSPEEIAASLLSVIDDEAALTAKVEVGYRRLARYDWDEMAAQFVEVYTTLATSDTGG